MKKILENITDFTTEVTDTDVKILRLKVKTAWYTLNIRDYVEINPETGRRWKKKHVIVESGRKSQSTKTNLKPNSSSPEYYNRNGHYRQGPSMNRKGHAEREEN